MNAAQIASQMRDLSLQLVTALGVEDDVNVAAVLGHLTPAFAYSSGALNFIANIAENSDGPGWDTVMSEAGRAHHLLSVTSTGLAVAAEAAKSEQDDIAELTRAGAFTPV